MGRRINPLSLRLKTLTNWPSNVRHPFLTKYIQHIFQDYNIAQPSIRSSTNGIWINLTVLENPSKPITSHPKYKNPVLDFKELIQSNWSSGKYKELMKQIEETEREKQSGGNNDSGDGSSSTTTSNLNEQQTLGKPGIRNALGKYDKTVWWLKNQHEYYKSIHDPNTNVLSFPMEQYDSPDSGENAVKSFHIFTDNMNIPTHLSGKIFLRFNVLRNPLLNGDVLAQFVAKELKDGKSLAMVYKGLLSKMN
jgi:hypothetical protein